MAPTTLDAQQTQALAAQLSALCNALQKLVAVEAAPDAKWAHIKLDWQRSEVMEALRLCASSGHLDVIKYLVQTFNVTADDVRSDRNSALLMAAGGGHLDVIKYFVDVVGLTADDVRSCNNDALCVAASGGHLDVLKFLVEASKLTKEEVEDDADLVRFASAHPRVLEYLKDKCKARPTMTKEEVAQRLVDIFGIELSQ